MRNLKTAGARTIPGTIFESIREQKSFQIQGIVLADAELN